MGRDPSLVGRAVRVKRFNDKTARKDEPAAPHPVAPDRPLWENEEWFGGSVDAASSASHWSHQTIRIVHCRRRNRFRCPPWDVFWYSWTKRCRKHNHHPHDY